MTSTIDYSSTDYQNVWVSIQSIWASVVNQLGEALRSEHINPGLTVSEEQSVVSILQQELFDHWGILFNVWDNVFLVKLLLIGWNHSEEHTRELSHSLRAHELLNDLGDHVKTSAINSIGSSAIYMENVVSLEAMVISHLRN